MSSTLKALLVLEDGFCMTGELFAGKGEVYGEVVFSTGMSGYQEMITDPSYCGQILTFTYPLIGNYGICPGDNESALPRTPAVLVKENCLKPHNRRARESLASFLEKHGILGVEGIDTRTLTLHLRRHGTMKGVISSETLDPEELQKKLHSYPGIAGTDLVKHVTTSTNYTWNLREDCPELPEKADASASSSEPHVVVVDLGTKYSILRSLTWRGARVTVVPAGTNPEDIKALEPDGILLSNGPGDPSALDYLTNGIKELLGWRPIMGICLGHQLLGRAMGIDTFKLTFGHRGVNHPVKNHTNDRVLITTQNHGFCLSKESPLPGNTRLTHTSLFDHTIEGMQNPDWNFFSVQFHPEASPGTHDGSELFDAFYQDLL